MHDDHDEALAPTARIQQGIKDADVAIGNASSSSPPSLTDARI